MGKKVDALLGRSFKTNKFKALLNLALSRLSILKNQRQVRCSQAISDVTDLLNLGHHENAYHRVDHVIEDQNTLDVLFFIHGYFTLLLDRVHLLEHNTTHLLRYLTIFKWGI
ncbi:BnaC08g40420D [Brassica napus]|uniref:BnaC08g40420D protein n=2 Tax=Brassica TaxID=3705 RepID=A0A078FSM0_BRANA|nr:hypothetical protein Bca52824_079118 [Brassica carinata]CDY16081.1 BnaC08g40420D [Brassica napus]